MKTMPEAIKELQEAAIVMAEIQSRQAKVLKEHREWLQEHDRAMVEMRQRAEAHDRAMENMREFGQKLDERIDKLVIAILAR